MDGLFEKARDTGRLLGQTEEYKALQRARQRISEDRDLVQLLNRLGELEVEIGRSLQRGEDPPEERAEEYEKAFADVQSKSQYQGLVAAQANFDKVVARVNEEISKGIETGAQSRIILPS